MGAKMNLAKICLIGLISSILLAVGCDATVTALTMQPDTYDYGRVNIGDSTGYIIKIVNDTTQSQTLTGITISGIHRSDFYISAGMSTYVRLAAGRTYSVTIMFNPKAAGPRYAQLEVTSTADVPRSIAPLKGFGINVSRLGLVEKNYDFEDVFVSGSKEHTFTVTNEGTSQLSINSFRFIGVGANYFSIVSTTTPIYIHAQQSDTFTVKAAPTAIGTFSAIMEISHNGANENPFRVYLNVNGVNFSPKFEFGTTSPVDFGEVVVSNPLRRNIKLMNTGLDPLTISSIDMVTNSEFKFVEALNSSMATISLPVQVTPGGYIWAVVEFKPTSVTTFQDKMQVTHNGVNVSSPSEIDVTGKGK